MKNKYKYWYVISESKKSKLLYEKFNDLILKSEKWELSENYEFLFVFGGDGTLLKTIKNIKNNTKVILINGGNFGFFSFFDKKNLDTIFEYVLDNKNYITPTLISTEYDEYKIYSLNEVVINSNHLINAEVYLNNYLYENFRGTGLLISTPLGSTGRTKSNKGAIISPHLNLIQLLEIEPLSQKEYRTLDSPLILDSNTSIDIKIKKIKDSFFLISDGDIIEVKNKKDIKIKSIKAKFKLFYFDSINDFINKLKKKYISTE